MRRILIIYNPRSSRYQDVKKDVLGQISSLNGFMVGKYEVEKTDVDVNAKSFAKILKDDDLVIAAGGDATGVIAVNAILNSGKNATLAVLPYGNFNDLSRTLGTKTIEDILHKPAWVGDGAGEGATARRRDSSTVGETTTAGSAQNSTRRFYPLEIYVDGKFFRYASCYVTIGMMAEAVKLYDSPKMRKKLKTSFGRKISSYTYLAAWYFKNRHRKIFIPVFKLNGKLQPSKTSDYAAVNGRYMARVMRGGEDYKNSQIFRSETDRLTNFWRLIKLMTKSIFVRIPGSKTDGDLIEFSAPATVELQAEGEYHIFKDIKTIEIRKSKKCLKVVTR